VTGKEYLLASQVEISLLDYHLQELQKAQVQLMQLEFNSKIMVAIIIIFVPLLRTEILDGIIL